MAMPQRDETIEEIKRLDALLEYAVMHGDEAEAARLCASALKLMRQWSVVAPTVTAHWKANQYGASTNSQIQCEAGKLNSSYCCSCAKCAKLWYNIRSNFGRRDKT